MNERASSSSEPGGPETSPAPTEATALVGTPLPAELLAPDPELLGPTLRGSGTHEGTFFTGELPPEAPHRRRPGAG